MLNEDQQEELITGLVAMIRSSPAFYVGQFRLFEVGDFYNQAVVDVWTEVVKRLPTVKFWAYTRSFHLDFSRMVKLNNMCLFGSADSENKEAAEAFAEKYGLRVAYALPKGVHEPIKGSIVCPQQTGKVSSCWSCGLCFKTKKSKNISFIYH
jgi:hypothetical protein